MEFPFLSIITLSPIVAAIIILMLPKERGENARMLGLAAMLIGLVLCGHVVSPAIDRTEMGAARVRASRRDNVCKVPEFGGFVRNTT